MQTVFFAGAFVILAAIGIAAEPRWIRLQSPNFEIYSTGGEAATLSTLRQFEQARAFFLTVMPIKDLKPLPVRIVQFNSEKEYLPYRPNSFATAYFKPGAERDVIVMSHGGAENMSLSMHEYTHLFMRHAGFDLAPWLDEGLAEIYSTLQQTGNKIVIGHPIAGRLLGMVQNKWVPLSIVLSADHTSPYYNEANKAGSFYDESWALTHMLALGADYRPKWRDVLKGVIAGKDSAEVLTSVYGKPIALIEQDLKGYIRSPSFSAGVFDARLEKLTEKYPVEPAPSFDLKLILLDIATGNSPEQTEKQLEQLAAEQPTRPEPYVEEGYLKWGAGKPADDQVRERFKKAYDLGGRSPRMLWDYGRIIEASEPAAAIEVLTALSELEPERRDVKIEMAGAMHNANHSDDAIATLLTLHGCSPAEAPRCMGIASYAYLKLNELEKAQTAAEQYLHFAKTAEDRQNAQRILDALKMRAASPPVIQKRESPAASAALNPKGGPSPADSAVIETTPPRLARITLIKGTFVEFVCGGAMRQIVLETPSGRQRFLIDQPTSIRLIGTKEDTTDLQCGEQKPAPAIELGFAAAPAGTDASGLVRSLNFAQ